MPINKPRQQLCTWDKLTLYVLTKLTIAPRRIATQFSIAEISARAAEFITSGYANVSTHPSAVKSAVTKCLNRFIKLGVVQCTNVQATTFFLQQHGTNRYFAILQSEHVVELCNAIYEAATSTGLSLNAGNCNTTHMAYAKVLAKYHASRCTLEILDKLVLYAVDRLNLAHRRAVTKDEIKEKVVQLVRRKFVPYTTLTSVGINDAVTNCLNAVTRNSHRDGLINTNHDGLAYKFSDSWLVSKFRLELRMEVARVGCLTVSNESTLAATHQDALMHSVNDRLNASTANLVDVGRYGTSVTLKVSDRFVMLALKDCTAPAKLNEVKLKTNRLLRRTGVHSANMSVTDTYVTTSLNRLALAGVANVTSRRGVEGEICYSLMNLQMVNRLLEAVEAEVEHYGQTHSSSLNYQLLAQVAYLAVFSTINSDLLDSVYCDSQNVLTARPRTNNTESDLESVYQELVRQTLQKAV